MKATTSDTLTRTKQPGIIHITAGLRARLIETNRADWESLFNEFRLELQCRIAGSDDRELLKLQAKIDWVNELEGFFTSVHIQT